MDDRIQQIHESVKDYYSRLTTQKDGELASAACSCASGSIPDPVRKIVSLINESLEKS